MSTVTWKDSFISKYTIQVIHLANLENNPEDELK